MSDQPPAPVTYSAAPAPRGASTTSCALVFLAWAVVGVPAVWGVSQTFQKSLDLFRAPPPATQPASSPASSPTVPPAR